MCHKLGDSAIERALLTQCSKFPGSWCSRAVPVALLEYHVANDCKTAAQARKQEAAAECSHAGHQARSSDSSTPQRHNGIGTETPQRQASKRPYSPGMMLCDEPSPGGVDGEAGASWSMLSTIASRGLIASGCTSELSFGTGSLQLSKKRRGAPELGGWSMAQKC